MKLVQILRHHKANRKSILNGVYMIALFPT